MSARAEAVRTALTELGWTDDPDSVTFLAEGEYHENWRFEFSRADGTAVDAVFRINHGSQLDLEDQIAYEYRVLGAVAHSKRTPAPLALAAGHQGLGNGVLAMGFIHGRPFQYQSDSVSAVRTLAQIHTSVVLPSTIIEQASPLSDVAAECRRLLGRTKRLPQRIRETLLDTADELDRLQGQSGAPGTKPFTVCNTEVNSGNWIVSANECFLVDWEKAVVTDPVQDLAHFISPTTTRWKTDFSFSTEFRTTCIEEYSQARSGADLWSLDELMYRTNLMEQAVRLRALSWCLMAYEEYESGDKEIVNEDTRAKLRWYRESWEELLVV